ncbi:MAG: hypothetical protein Q9211_006576, partial [Gyalolechia sp. 1 TL-2023]
DDGWLCGTSVAVVEDELEELRVATTTDDGPPEWAWDVLVAAVEAPDLELDELRGAVVGLPPVLNVVNQVASITLIDVFEDPGFISLNGEIEELIAGVALLEGELDIAAFEEYVDV